MDLLDFNHVGSRTKELEDLAGNSMNVRAAAAGWIALFACVDVWRWNAVATTKEDSHPLLPQALPS